MHKLHIDIETYSSVDIRTAGLYKYAESGDFEVLLIAYAIDGEPVRLIDLKSVPETAREQAALEYRVADLIEALKDPNIIKCAYNAPFEMACLSRHFGISINPARWECVMVKGLYNGYPAGLARIGEAMGLPQEKAKMREGTSLINYFCKPCNPTKTNGGRTRNLPEHAPDKWETFKTYCIRDVEVEREVDTALTPLTNTLKKEWVEDYGINTRGVHVDSRLIDTAIAVGDDAKARTAQELKRITGVSNPRSRVQVLEWLTLELGYTPESLNAEAVNELLVGDLTDDARTVLTGWQFLNKTSTKKYDALKKATCNDGRVRGLLQFYGASRTGRWAGRIVQPHNLPRGDVGDIAGARTLVRDGRVDDAEVLCGSRNDLLKGLIRTAFVPSPGRRFVVCDYSAIEARVLAWLAGEEWVLDEFRHTGRIYEATAAKMFNVPKDTIIKGNPNYQYRQKGKIATLALGYQGSVGALLKMGADKQGLTEAELLGLVRSWRAVNPNVVILWHEVQDAAIAAITGEGLPIVQAGEEYIYFACETTPHGLRLNVELPSGRLLYYNSPKVVDGAVYYTNYKHTGVQEEQTYGGKLVENIVQALARDCLSYAISRLSERYDVVLHVHDEVVIDVPMTEAEDALTCMLQMFCESPPWAPTLPLKGEGFISDFYKKG